MAELMTVEELADMLKVTTQTIYNWRKAQYGPKPMFLSAKAVRYRVDDVEAWMKDNEGWEVNGDNDSS